MWSLASSTPAIISFMFRADGKKAHFLRSLDSAETVLSQLDHWQYQEM
jgi:hypothetical protein